MSENSTFWNKTYVSVVICSLFVIVGNGWNACICYFGNAVVWPVGDPRRRFLDIARRKRLHAHTTHVRTHVYAPRAHPKKKNDLCVRLACQRPSTSFCFNLSVQIDLMNHFWSQYFVILWNFQRAFFFLFCWVKFKNSLLTQCASMTKFGRPRTDQQSAGDLFGIAWCAR